MTTRGNTLGRQAAKQARQLMPADGDLDALVSTVATRRGRPITVLDTELDGGLTGLWIATPTSDYIVIDQGCTASRRAAVLCHEVAHMLLGHLGAPVSEDLATLAPTLRPTLAGRFLTRHGYTEPDEHAAEHLATYLVAEHARRERAAQLRQNPISARLR